MKYTIFLVFFFGCSSFSSKQNERKLASDSGKVKSCHSLVLKATNARSNARAAALSEKNMRNFYSQVFEYIDDETTYDDLADLIVKAPLMKGFDPEGFLAKSIRLSGDKAVEHSEAKLEDELKYELYRFLLQKSKLATTKDEFFTLLDKMRFAQISPSRQYEIIVSAPYLKSILDKNDDLNLKNAFSPNVEFDNQHLLKHIESVMSVLMEVDHQKAAGLVNNSLSFLKMMERISEQSLFYNRDVLEALAESPFGERMELGLGKISQIAVRISKLPEGSRRTSAISDIIKDEILAYKIGAKQLDSFSRFDEEVNVLKVKNQCHWGSCWVFAGTSKIETEISSKLGKRVPLSPEYFYARYIIDSIGNIIQDGKELPKDKLFTEGGTFYLHKLLSNSYGAVPENVWKPNFDFGQTEQKTAMLAELKKVLEAFFTLRKAFTDPAQLSQLKAEYQARIKPIVEKYSGVLPKEFEFEGELLTPQEFMMKYYPEIKRTPVHYTPSDMVGEARLSKVSFPVEIIKDGGWAKKEIEVKAQRITIEEMEKTIISELKAQRPVFIAFNVPLEADYKDGERLVPFIDRKTGLMSAPTDGREVSIKGGHGVLAIGAELNAVGRIKTIKVLNSWGEGKGDAGILYMDNSFFRFWTKVNINE